MHQKEQWHQFPLRFYFESESYEGNILYAQPLGFFTLPSRCLLAPSQQQNCQMNV